MWSCSLPWPTLELSSEPSGDAKWKPTIARKLSVVWKESGRGGRGTYRAKVEWVEIGHEDLWIHIFQIPGEALALQPLPEVHATPDVSKGPLWKQFQAAAIKKGGGDFPHYSHCPGFGLGGKTPLPLPHSRSSAGAPWLMGDCLKTAPCVAEFQSA